jgi:hypothetical protein
MDRVDSIIIYLGLFFLAVLLWHIAGIVFPDLGIDPLVRFWGVPLLLGLPFLWLSGLWSDVSTQRGRAVLIVTSPVIGFGMSLMVGFLLLMYSCFFRGECI